MTEQRVYMDIHAERIFKWLAVGIISLIAFEAIAVGTAMPTVVKMLDGQNLYALAMGIPMAGQLITTAFAGLWCDAKTPQSCLYTGIAVLTAGLLLCTFAPNMIVFVLGRTIQGLGGGMCIVPLYALIGGFVRPERQGSHFAAFSAAWVFPALVGPAIAGWIVEAFNWRLVFGLVPLLFILLFPLLIHTLRKLPRATDRRPLTKLGRTMVPALLTGISIACLQILSGTKAADFTGLTYILIVLAVAATFVFIRPLLPRGTYIARRGLASTILVRGITNGTFIGTEAFLPLLLQEMHGWSPTHAGFILTVGSVTWALGSWIQGKIINPETRMKNAVNAAFLQLAGLALIVPGAFTSVSPWLVVVGWTLAGLGTGLVYPTLSVHALAMSPQAQQGSTSSAIQLADTLGSATCVAGAGIMLAIFMPREDLSFAAAIGLMTLLFSAGVVVIRRIMPHPGSREEAQLNSMSEILERNEQ